MSNSIFYSVFFILLFSFFSGVLAQEKYEVNQKGEVLIKIEQPEHKRHNETSCEQKARQNPDKQIFYGNVESMLKKVDFWHYREIKIAHKSVRWSSNLKKFIYKTGNFVQSGEIKFVWNIVFIFITLGLTILFNFAIYNKVISKDLVWVLDLVLALTSAFAFALAFALVLALTPALAWAFAFALAFALVWVWALVLALTPAFLNGEAQKKKKIKISQRWLVVDYLLITAYLIFWFIL